MNLERIDNKMVFRRDTEYGTFYSIGISKKNIDGNYENSYIDVRFKKGIEIENKTRINILNSFLSFYLKTDSDGYNNTKYYIVINEFEYSDNRDKETVVETDEEQDEQLDIDIDELPW